MKTIKSLKGILTILSSALVSLLLATGAYADVESVVAEVEFVTPVQITETNALQFGLIDEAFANLETLTIAPDDTVSGDTGRIAGGTQAAATFDITATGSQTLSIQVSNITSNTGYSLGTFVCNYNSGTDTACQAAPYTPASAASAELRVGATMTGDGNAGAGVFNGSFDVTVVYQ